MPIIRTIYKVIKKDLNKKMVFLSGPRQCGKTTLAKGFFKIYSSEYYNWDIDEHRKIIRQKKLNESHKLWIFDELHKFKSWRNWLKGLFDLHHTNHKILVTGSARLDIYSRGGDSLQGRYFFHRLHPFTFAEITGKFPKTSFNQTLEFSLSSSKGSKKLLLDLLQLGGFPEPFLSGSEKESKRWRLTYGARLIKEDIRDLEMVQDLSKMELLFEHLPNTVGSILSINSLREDLEVSFETVRNWINIFEKNYLCFRIPPYGAPKFRAVKKESKLYLWDWAYIENISNRIENLIAFHLLRFVHWCEDVEGEKVELRYFRDTRGHEVDFIVMKNHKPWIAIEVKQSARDIDKNLKYLLERVYIPYAFQVHLEGNENYRVENINNSQVRVMPIDAFLINLP